MYYVTYKNVLKPEREVDDFRHWLKSNWNKQKEWGATSVNLWLSHENNRKILFCRYAIENLDQWNIEAMGPEADTLVRSLAEVIDIDQMSIKITVPSSENA